MSDETNNTPDDSEVTSQQPDVQSDAVNEDAEVAEQSAAQQEEAVVDTSKLESELAETKEQMLRMQAEMQNIRRRAQNDVEKAHKFALERFVKDLLPVLDSLEKAIEACEVGEDAPSQLITMKDGVEMTLSLMLSSMKKFDVEVVDPMGEAFNPEFHEAMSMVPRDDVEPNSVIAVLQKGYLLSGRLVRPAMVMVAKS